MPMRRCIGWPGCWKVVKIPNSLPDAWSSSRRKTWATPSPLAVVVATSIFHAVEVIGLPEAQINLAQGTTYLASCPKSNASYAGLIEARKDAKAFGNLPVPLHLRNAVTSLMKDLGYGKGYRYVHHDEKARTEQTHLPKELDKRKYYRP